MRLIPLTLYNHQPGQPHLKTIWVNPDKVIAVMPQTATRPTLDAQGKHLTDQKGNVVREATDVTHIIYGVETESDGGSFTVVDKNIIAMLTRGD